MSDAPDGMYIVKNGVTYQVTPRFAEHFPLAKKINVMTGEVTYATNADRIRAMTDEELAEFFRMAVVDQIEDARVGFGAWSGKEWLEWLKQEVTDNSAT